MLDQASQSSRGENVVESVVGLVGIGEGGEGGGVTNWHTVAGMNIV